MDARDEIIEWLHDAYAMERGMEIVLKKASSRDNYPDVMRFATEKHLDETRQHAETIEALLKSLGADTSKIKTSTSDITNALAGLGTIITHDELLKDLIASYAAEHFEIACYRTLIAGAEAAGMPRVAAACRQIIRNEEQMAETIQNILPQMAQDYLSAEQMAKAA